MLIDLANGLKLKDFTSIAFQYSLHQTMQKQTPAVQYFFPSRRSYIMFSCLLQTFCSFHL